MPGLCGAPRLLLQLFADVLSRKRAEKQSRDTCGERRSVLRLIKTVRRGGRWGGGGLEAAAGIFAGGLGFLL